MKKNLNKTIIISIVAIIILIAAIFIRKGYDKEETINVLENAVEENVIENTESTEIAMITETVNDEEDTEEQEVEDESFELQGEIAYNGDTNSSWNLTITGSAGLTYVSQIDSEWKNYFYTSTNNSSQTIGSSGCGVATATMVIDYFVGQVDIRNVADTFVENGYRSANNGTYWSAYRAVADQYNLTYTETSNIDTAISLLDKGYKIVCSCGNGLFTYNGHYIFIYAYENGYFKIYDPYLYSGKFDTSTRSGKATVNGDTVYVSYDNFKDYANYRNFFCYYSNNSTDITETKTTDNSYKRYVKVNSYLNVRNSVAGSIIGKLYNGYQVTVYETSGNWSRIGDNEWVYSSYLSTKYNTTTTTTSYTTGKYRVTASLLRVRKTASTQYHWKYYYQLSANAKYQNKKLGNYDANGYLKGVICTVTKISGNWGYTPSGWICLDFCNKI